jgi:hypothetical protein
MDMKNQQVTLVDYNVLIEGSYYKWMKVKAFDEESAQALARERFEIADADTDGEQTFVVEKEEY